jgi:F-type H+-transporting ATPase subunit a
MIDPLHQFLINPLIQISLAGYDISFTNSSLFMVLATLSSIALMFAATRSPQLIPGRMQFVGESLHRFVGQMIKDNVGDEGMPYLPYVVSLFLFIFNGKYFGNDPLWVHFY